jgi:hypothetical protein
MGSFNYLVDPCYIEIRMSHCDFQAFILLLTCGTTQNKSKFYSAASSLK